VPQVSERESDTSIGRCFETGIDPGAMRGIAARFGFSKNNEVVEMGCRTLMWRVVVELRLKSLVSPLLLPLLECAAQSDSLSS
jgi:hypothetical protein